MPEIKSQISFLPNLPVLLFILCILFYFTVPTYGGTENLRENAVVKAIEKVSPAVVNISSEFEVHKRVNPFSGFGLDPSFESF